MVLELLGSIKPKLYKKNKMNLIKKLSWLWKLFWGRRYIVTPVKEGLKEDEVLFYKHKVYVLEKEEEKC